MASIRRLIWWSRGGHSSKGVRFRHSKWESQHLPSGVVTVDSAPIQPIEFTVDSGTTNVRGTVLDRQQQPVMGARAVLVPAPPARYNIRLYRYGTSAPNGAFQFSSIAPGEYKVFAWDAALGQCEYDTEFLARIEAFGQRVTVKPDTPVTGVPVQMIPRQ